MDNNTIGDSHNSNIFVAYGKGHLWENNALTNASTGITLDYVSSGIFESVRGGIVKFNNMQRNECEFVQLVTIKNNDVHGNEKGISLWNSSVVVIKEQNSSYNDIGFYLGKSGVNRENMRAFNNTKSGFDSKTIAPIRI